MHYEDTARPYNFLAGLGIGAAVGIAVALLALPQKRVLRRELARGGHRLGLKARRSRTKSPRMRSGAGRRGEERAEGRRGR